MHPKHSSLIKHGFPIEEQAVAPETERKSSVVRAREARVLSQPYHLAELKSHPAAPPSVAPSNTAPAKAEEQQLSREDLDALRAEWEAEWQARHAAELDQARAIAYEEGQAAAHAEWEAVVEEERAAVRQDLERLHAQFDDYLKKLEPMLADLAFEVARQLLAAPLPEDVQRVSAQALTHALDTFRDAAAIDIVLHPGDLDRLEAAGLTDDIGALYTGLRWKTDETLDPGDWIVQSPEAAVRRLKQELLANLKSRVLQLSVARRKEPGDVMDDLSEPENPEAA